MSFVNFASKALTIAEMEARKIRHDSSELWMRCIQPALWLVVFGSALSKVRGLSTGSYSYLQFLSAGVLAQSVMFIAILYGVKLIWERDVGMLTKLLSTPALRDSYLFLYGGLLILVMLVEPRGLVGAWNRLRRLVRPARRREAVS